MDNPRTIDRNLHGSREMSRPVDRDQDRIAATLNDRALWLEWLTGRFGPDRVGGEKFIPPVTLRGWIGLGRPAITTKPRAKKSTSKTFKCRGCGGVFNRPKFAWKRSRCVECQAKRDRKMDRERCAKRARAKKSAAVAARNARVGQ